MKSILVALFATTLLVSTVYAAKNFEGVDADKDGKVTQSEVQQAGLTLDKDTFTKADADGDGTLNADEFKNYHVSGHSHG
ncbi:calcium-binding protein [Desulfocurvibacter africanus]|uniref:calcium-binding protein n=1 Tax=Desulfocurvibacter africanus TaxID=873 RepID=UPI000418A8C5|nr:calcium-binding protein [Desulfocurvibacter africanus]